MKKTKTMTQDGKRKNKTKKTKEANNSLRQFGFITELSC